MMNTMQIRWAKICQSWAVRKSKPQSAWSKRNSPWSNLPKGWGIPTLVPSTSGRKYGWLGFRKRSIGQLSRDRTVWNSFELDPCTGRRRLPILWRLWRPGYHWRISRMPNGFGDITWRCFQTNVQASFRRWGPREGEATRDQWPIWQSARPKQWEVSSPSCQIQLSWLLFVECQMATMTRHPAINSKHRTQMWGTGWWWLISSNKIVARKNHIVWLWYTSAAWRTKNWTMCKWDYKHPGKWWITVYMARFHTTVPFLMPSSWNWDTIWNYFW